MEKPRFAVSLIVMMLKEAEHGSLEQMFTELRLKNQAPKDAFAKKL